MNYMIDTDRIPGNDVLYYSSKSERDRMVKSWSKIHDAYAVTPEYARNRMCESIALVAAMKLGFGSVNHLRKQGKFWEIIAAYKISQVL